MDLNIGIGVGITIIIVSGVWLYCIASGTIATLLTTYLSTSIVPIASKVLFGVCCTGLFGGSFLSSYSITLLCNLDSKEQKINLKDDKFNDILDDILKTINCTNVDEKVKEADDIYDWPVEREGVPQLAKLLKCLHESY